MRLSPYDFMTLIRSSMESSGLVDDLSNETNRSYRKFLNGKLIPKGSIDLAFDRQSGEHRLSGEFIAVSVAGTIDNSTGTVVYGIKLACMSNPDKKLVHDEIRHGIVQYEARDGKEVYVTAFFDIQAGLVEYLAVSKVGEEKVPNPESIRKVNLEDAIRKLFSQIGKSVFDDREKTED
mgnify:CR=1 FL=1